MTQNKKYPVEQYPYSDLTEKIIGAAYAVHNRLGSGFVEKVYENALAKELESLGVKVNQQQELSVNYGGEPIGDFSVDLLVDEKIIVEVKAVQTLEKSHEEKVLHYLKASGCEVGLLINFGKKVGVRRKIYSQPHSSAKSAISETSAASAKISPNDIGHEYISYCRRRLLQEYLPRIQRCVNELSEEDVWWRAYETNNSVGNLILHLCGNVRQWIISGIGGAPDLRERSKEFSERGPIPKAALLKNLEETLLEANHMLEQFDVSKLLEVRRIQKYDVTCLDAISHVVEHFAQHTGQIIYITKLRKGIDLKFFDL